MPKHRYFTLARPGIRNLLPCQATHFNLQSQSLYRSYGSNLSTSLTYIILSTRGSSPWRLAADMGTNPVDGTIDDTAVLSVKEIPKGKNELSTNQGIKGEVLL
ncbi:hypothetical protein JTB14_006126 [Gonioctena quinquepunctata]|nr:hypothetical protein JTB14_006126 [Gonioctena quinquepunctata]